MKMKSIVVSSLVAVFTALSASSYAASDMSSAGEAKEPKGGAQAEKATTMRPHSHMEEKTGIPQKALSARAEKPKASPATDKHSHPRDGK